VAFFTDASQLAVTIGRFQKALLCAKAKRQQQSDLSELKSAQHYGGDTNGGNIHQSDEL